MHPGISRSILLPPSVRNLSDIVGDPELDRLRGRVLGFDGLSDWVWSWVCWTQSDRIQIVRGHIHGVLQCHIRSAYRCSCSVDPGMVPFSRLLDPRVTRFADLKIARSPRCYSFF